MNTTNLAIAVPVWIPDAASPRAGYFKRHLNNLALASRYWHVYFFVDGGSDEQLIQSLIESSGLRGHTIVPSPVRFGLGLNIHRARRFIFDEGHSAMFLCESDVVITYDLITLCSHVLDWAASQGWSPAIANSAITYYSDDPHAVIPNLIGWSHYLMPRAAYEMMRPALDDYADFLRGVAYENRPHAAIQQWLRDRFAAPAQSTNQDAVNATIARRLGIHRFSLARNRAIHVGEIGTNSTPEWHARVGHSSQVLHPHENDTSQRYFTIIPAPAPPVASGSGGSISG